VVLGRLLEPKHFGVVALAVIVIDLGQMLINRGFGASIVQRQDLTDEHLDSAFWFSVAAGLALTAAFGLSAGVIADAFDEPQLAAVLRVLAFNWVLGAFASVPRNILQRELRFRSLALRQLVAVTVSGAVGIGLAVAGHGVWSLVVQALVQSAVSVAVLWAVSPWRPRWRASVQRLREMQGFATSVVGIDLLRFFAVRGEGFVIGAAVGPVSLGYYAVATRFHQLLNEAFTSTVGVVAFPVFSRLQDERERRQRALFSVLRMTSLAAFPAFGLVAVLAPEIIKGVFGTRWEPSVVLAQLLALHGLRYSITYFISSVVVSTGMAALELRLTIVGVAVKAVALAIGVQWGVIGVTWAVVAASYVTLPLTLWALWRTTGITARTYLRQVVEPGVAALVMVAVVAGARILFGGLADLATLAVCSAIGAVTYLAAIGALAPKLLAEARSYLVEVVRRPTPSAVDVTVAQ